MATRERLVSVPAARSHIDAVVADPILKTCMHNVLDAIPAVDAVEVVRCHECQQSYKSSGSSTGYRCKVWGVYDQDCDCDPNGFCHKGERRCDNG